MRDVRATTGADDLGTGGVQGGSRPLDPSPTPALQRHRPAHCTLGSEVDTCGPAGCPSPQPGTGPWPAGAHPPAPRTRSRGPKRKCRSSAALGFWMCFCSLACGRAGPGERAADRAGGAQGKVRGRGRGRWTHEQVDGQLGFLETVDELGLRGRSRPQREDALCRRLLPLLLPLLALVQLLERLCRLLQPRHEPLDVIQGAVEDLLRAGRGGVSGRPALQGQPHRCPSARVRPDPTYRLLLYLLSQHGPRRLLVQRLPTAEACGVRGAG